VRRFKDGKGREWEIAVTYGLCRRLKADLAQQGINLLEPLLPRGVDPASPEAKSIDKAKRPTLFAELQTDLLLFFDLLEAIVAPQLKEAGVDKDGENGFGCAMAGDHIFAAQTAFVEEWSDFFQSLHRTEIVTAMGKSQAWWEKAVKAMEAQVTDSRLDAAMERKLAEVTSSGSGKLLALLDSIPSTAPSGN
jgi:hypothetical protein